MNTERVGWARYNHSKTNFKCLLGSSMKPLTLVFLFVFIFALLGLPIAYLVDTEGLFFVLTRRVEESYIFTAYLWTVISFCLLLLLLEFLTVRKNFDQFLHKPISPSVFVSTDRLWFYTLLISLALTGLMFIRAGFSIPLLEASDNPTLYLIQRKTFKENISPVLFNANALGVGVFNLSLALFFAEKNRKTKILTSILNYLLLASFSLAKSSFGTGILILLLYYAFLKPIPIKKLARVGVVFFALIVPMFMIAKVDKTSWTDGKGIATIIAGRIFYGQWTALPFFWEAYERRSAGFGTVLPGYLKSGDQRWEYRGEEAPARYVIHLTTGYRDLERAGVGVAVTYFIGEAFALAGYMGVFLACLLVACEFWMLSFSFRYFKKTPITIFLYSWFLYKFTIGLITGISAFLLTSTTVLLFFVFIMVLLSRSQQKPVRKFFAKQS